jgi:hypothetical protein
MGLWSSTVGKLFGGAKTPSARIREEITQEQEWRGVQADAEKVFKGSYLEEGRKIAALEGIRVKRQTIGKANERGNQAWVAALNLKNTWIGNIQSSMANLATTAASAAGQKALGAIGARDLQTTVFAIEQRIRNSIKQMENEVQLEVARNRSDLKRWLLVKGGIKQSKDALKVYEELLAKEDHEVEEICQAIREQIKLERQELKNSNEGLDRRIEALDDMIGLRRAS